MAARRPETPQEADSPAQGLRDMADRIPDPAGEEGKRSGRLPLRDITKDSAVEGLNLGNELEGGRKEQLTARKETCIGEVNPEQPVCFRLADVNFEVRQLPGKKKATPMTVLVNGWNLMLGQEEGVVWDLSSLDSDQTVVLGRGGEDEPVDIKLAEARVSRQHAQLRIDRQGRVLVTDLGSTNGSFAEKIVDSEEEAPPAEAGLSDAESARLDKMGGEKKPVEKEEPEFPETFEEPEAPVPMREAAEAEEEGPPEPEAAEPPEIQSIPPEVQELFTELVGLTEKIGKIEPEVKKKIKAAFRDKAQAQMLRELLETHLLEGLQELFSQQDEIVFGPVLGRTRAYRNIVDAVGKKDEVRERLRAAIKRTSDLRKSGKKIGKEPILKEEEEELLDAIKLLEERKQNHKYRQEPSESRVGEEIKDMGPPEEVDVREEVRGQLREADEEAEVLAGLAITLIREDLQADGQLLEDDQELLATVFGEGEELEARREAAGKFLNTAMARAFAELETQETATAGQVRDRLLPLMLFYTTLRPDLKNLEAVIPKASDEGFDPDKLEKLKALLVEDEAQPAEPPTEVEEELDDSERLRVEMGEALEKLNSKEELPQKEREALALQVLASWVEARKINADWAQERVVLRGVAAVATVDAPEEVRDSIADLIDAKLEEILEGVTGNE